MEGLLFFLIFLASLTGVFFLFVFFSKQQIKKDTLQNDENNQDENLKKMQNDITIIKTIIIIEACVQILSIIIFIIINMPKH